MRKLLFVMLPIISGCSGKSNVHHAKSEITASMNRYNHFIQITNADSIASMFVTDGSLGKVKGRDSIRNFLSKFKNIKVTAFSATDDTTSVAGDSASQSGHYLQSGVINNIDTFHVKGRYQANWIFNDVSGWLLKKMETFPE